MLRTFLRNNRGLILAAFVASQFIAMFQVWSMHKAPWQGEALSNAAGVLLYFVLSFVWFAMRQRRFAARKK